MEGAEPIQFGQIHESDMKRPIQMKIGGILKRSPISLCAKIFVSLPDSIQTVWECWLRLACRVGEEDGDRLRNDAYDLNR